MILQLLSNGQIKSLLKNKWPALSKLSPEQCKNLFGDQIQFDQEQSFPVIHEQFPLNFASGAKLSAQLFRTEEDLLETSGENFLDPEMIREALKEKAYYIRYELEGQIGGAVEGVLGSLGFTLGANRHLNLFFYQKVNADKTVLECLSAALPHFPVFLTAKAANELSAGEGIKIGYGGNLAMEVGLDLSTLLVPALGTTLKQLKKTTKELVELALVDDVINFEVAFSDQFDTLLYRKATDQFALTIKKAAAKSWNLGLSPNLRISISEEGKTKISTFIQKLPLDNIPIKAEDIEKEVVKYAEKQIRLGLQWKLKREQERSTIISMEMPYASLSEIHTDLLLKRINKIQEKAQQDESIKITALFDEQTYKRGSIFNIGLEIGGWSANAKNQRDLAYSLSEKLGDLKKFTLKAQAVRERQPNKHEKGLLYLDFGLQTPKFLTNPSYGDLETFMDFQYKREDSKIRSWDKRDFERFMLFSLSTGAINAAAYSKIATQWEAKLRPADKIKMEAGIRLNPQQMLSIWSVMNRFEEAKIHAFAAQTLAEIFPLSDTFSNSSLLRKQGLEPLFFNYLRNGQQFRDAFYEDQCRDLYRNLLEEPRVISQMIRTDFSNWYQNELDMDPGCSWDVIYSSGWLDKVDTAIPALRTFAPKVILQESLEEDFSDFIALYQQLNDLPFAQGANASTHYLAFGWLGHFLNTLAGGQGLTNFQLQYQKADKWISILPA
ncbi:hypothetical protein [Persicobacter diffluens]|uniref:Uncharacterized protein n=1 Tax=Persicobacter diffluens TaxID=981 RepID=A0AAN4VYN6_9BACT|nr:hypothetical protein PEDI_17820 [Persicobacter diffluens]